MPRLDAIRQIGVVEPTCYRWPKQYDGMGLDRLKDLKRLHTGTERFRRAVSDLAFDKLKLREAARDEGRKANHQEDGLWPRTCSTSESRPERLAIEVKRKFNSTDVIDVLTKLFILRGASVFTFSENGPAFLAQAVRDWIVALGAKIASDQPFVGEMIPRFNSGSSGHLAERILRKLQRAGEE